VFSLISSFEQCDREISDEIADRSDPFTRVYLSAKDSQTKITSQIARMIKAKGTRISVITAESTAALNALRGFESKRIGGSGYGFLLS
jgi:ABC-type xylose transport system substrate-binding protein